MSYAVSYDSFLILYLKLQVNLDIIDITNCFPIINYFNFIADFNFIQILIDLLIIRLLQLIKFIQHSNITVIPNFTNY